jgi:hypothetical protein
MAVSGVRQAVTLMAVAFVMIVMIVVTRIRVVVMTVRVAAIAMIVGVRRAVIMGIAVVAMRASAHVGLTGFKRSPLEIGVDV